MSYASLDGLRVIDAMHPGLISCPNEAPLRTVARMMATYRVHAVLVASHGETEETRWGILSDAGLLRAAESGDLDEQLAGELAATPVLTVASSDPLARAAELMVEHEVSHLVVVERRSGTPLGVISTLDLARALAGFPETHPSGH